MRPAVWPSHGVWHVIRLGAGLRLEGRGWRHATLTEACLSAAIWRVVGGVGSESEPWEVNDLVIFERCISEPAEPPAWRMKERMTWSK